MEKVDNKEVLDKGSKKAWERLLQKVYEVDPLVCPKCGSEMKIDAVIQDRSEIEKIIACLEKKNKLALSETERSPPVKNAS